MIHTTDAEAQAAASSGLTDQEELEALATEIPPLNKLKNFLMISLDFEKVIII